METVTIDMRPEPFELPFKPVQLEMIEQNRVKLWQEQRKELGGDSVFLRTEGGMLFDNEDGVMKPYHPIQAGWIHTQLSKAYHSAKDFVQYHERHADEHGGLNVGRCHEWGDARYYTGDERGHRGLLYGIRLEFNDGSVLLYTIESWSKDRLTKTE